MLPDEEKISFVFHPFLFFAEMPKVTKILFRTIVKKADESREDIRMEHK